MYEYFLLSYVQIKSQGMNIFCCLMFKLKVNLTISDTHYNMTDNFLGAMTTKFTQKKLRKCTDQLSVRRSEILFEQYLLVGFQVPKVAWVSEENLCC